MRVKLGLAAACMVAGTLLSTGAALADFRGERHEVFRGQPHSFGPRCAHRLGAYGEGSSDFFRGGGGIRKAELRAIRHWEEKASLEFGPRFASWQRAAGKDLRCDRQGLRVSCQAVAHPCASNGGVFVDGPPVGRPGPGPGPYGDRPRPR